MEKAKEILEKMKHARSWKESEISMDDVASVLNELVSTKSQEPNDSAELRRLKSKVERLTESNKQLMAENKKLKGNT